jgi:hypothetical protein
MSWFKAKDAESWHTYGPDSKSWPYIKASIRLWVYVQANVMSGSKEIGRFNNETRSCTNTFKASTRDVLRGLKRITKCARSHNRLSKRTVLDH